MNHSEYLRRQFAYDVWANQAVLAALEEQGADSRSLELMVHIVASEQLWLDRLMQQPQSTAVWPTADLLECRLRASHMERSWREYMDRTTEDDLETVIPYKNSKGETWTSTVRDILNHVLMHSTYHRGQIATHMREKGQIPAYTDFIHAIRQGLVR
ncbi:MAG TPA: DinB family protein [Candidatus Sulfotelmatobacter sp.]|nr:DinB family protein [Candidatus Sulfotelmatobacter sp.]